MSNRPILIVTVIYVIGIIMGLYKKNIALFLYLISIVALAVAIIVIIKVYNCAKHKKLTIEKECNYNVILNRQQKIMYIKKAIICIGIIGIAMFNVTCMEKKVSSIYTNANNQSECIAVVEEMQEESKYYYKFKIKIKKLNNSTKYKDMGALLLVKKEKSNKNSNLEYGNLVSFVGEITEPEHARNYKGFDYANYLKSENIYAIFRCNSNQVGIIKKNNANVIKMWINNVKMSAKMNLKTILNSKQAAIANALLLGNSQLIEDKDKKEFSNASLAHILAISGMHIAYVMMFCKILLKKISKRKSLICTMILLILFAEFTGATPSVVRAVIMCNLSIIAKLLHRKSNTLNNIALSALIILLINPYSIINLSFQLSFLGTLGIVLFYPKLAIFAKKYNKGNIKHHIAQTLLLSISANILIVPVIACNFNLIVTTFLISNILVLPIISAMMGSGYITLFISFISLKICKIFSIPFKLCISAFQFIAKLCSNIPLTKFLITTPPSLVIILYYIAVFYFFYFYKKQHNKILKKSLIFIIILAIIIKTIPVGTNNLKLYFIDVGQGDSTLIVTNNNQTILIDGGGSETDDYDVGEKVLLPYLLNRGIKKIDFIIFSHMDSDHAKGLLYLMQNIKVKNAIIGKQFATSDNYESFKFLTNQKHINTIIVEAGQTLSIEKNLYLKVIWPDSNNVINNNILNNNSLVFKLVYESKSVLFTGDIESLAEEAILKKYSYNTDILRADILKVAHHGSKTSSKVEFLNAVNPQYALIGVGKNNKFGHPSEITIENLKYKNCAIYRTDMFGEIRMEIDKKGKVKISTMLPVNKYF